METFFTEYEAHDSASHIEWMFHIYQVKRYIALDEQNTFHVTDKITITVMKINITLRCYDLLYK